MKNNQLHELLYQALETELGGVQVYAAALECVMNDDLKMEWERYRGQTERHVEIVEDLLRTFDLDPSTETPGRASVRTIGACLVRTMEMARTDAPPEAAELVATECVTLAETKDHLNWELLRHASEMLSGDTGEALMAACDEVEDQEDEHLYHTTGWSRELWIQSLGLEAVLPPPEERKHVTTAIGAARAINERESMQ